MKAFVVVALALSAAPALADLKRPEESPRATVQQTIGLTEISVTYHRPAVAGRQRGRRRRFQRNDAYFKTDPASRQAPKVDFNKK